MVHIIGIILTGIVSYIGLQAKNIYQNFVNEKIKKYIVEKTVNYVEQIGNNLSCEKKKDLALKKSLEWLEEKKISASDTELEILIESAVNCLDKKGWKYPFLLYNKNGDEYEKP